MLAKIQSRLETAGIPYESIRVFGVCRINVHVLCVSRDTADKWVTLLQGAFGSSSVRMTPTTWEAAENKGTCLRKTMRQGFLIGVIA